MKKPILIALCCLGLGAGLAGCNNAESSGEESSIASSETKGVRLTEHLYSLEQYESHLFYYQTEGIEGEAIWSVDDASIATIDAGLLTAKKVGTCHISVSIGEYSDTCEVLVTEATDAAVLYLERESLSILKDDELVLDCYATYKGKMVETSFSVTFAEGEAVDVIEASAASGKLTVKALKAGSTVAIINGEANGTLLVRSLPITVTE